MLSRDLANLSEIVLGEDRIPRRLRARFAAVLAGHAEEAAEMERNGRPLAQPRPRMPQGVICIRTHCRGART